MIRQPRDFRVVFVEICFPQDWVVRATIKVYDDAATWFNFDSARRLNKLAIEGLRLAEIEAVKLMRQPAITAVRKHRQHRIKIDIQTHFARQTIQMKEVHTAPQRIFNSVPSRVVCHKIPRRDFGVELVQRLSGISMLVARDGYKVMLDCSQGLRFLVK